MKVKMIYIALTDFLLQKQMLEFSGWNNQPQI